MKEMGGDKDGNGLYRCKTFVRRCEKCKSFKVTYDVTEN